MNWFSIFGVKLKVEIVISMLSLIQHCSTRVFSDKWKNWRYWFKILISYRGFYFYLLNIYYWTNMDNKVTPEVIAGLFSEQKTYKDVRAIPQDMYPGERGFSTISVKLFVGNMVFHHTYNKIECNKWFRSLLNR